METDGFANSFLGFVIGMFGLIIVMICAGIIGEIEATRTMTNIEEFFTVSFGGIGGIMILCGIGKFFGGIVDM